MKRCDHPYCENQAADRGRFCSTSCRVGYHGHHKAKLQAMLTILQAQKTTINRGSGPVLDDVVRQLYRAARGWNGE